MRKQNHIKQGAAIRDHPAFMEKHIGGVRKAVHRVFDEMQALVIIVV